MTNPELRALVASLCIAQAKTDLQLAKTDAQLAKTDIRLEERFTRLAALYGNSIALLEVKHKAHSLALDQLEKQMKRYREVFPEHASYKLYGGAGLSVPDETVQ
jgi:hypothetical protein